LLHLAHDWATGKNAGLAGRWRDRHAARLCWLGGTRENSLLGTVKLNSMNSETYLRHVLSVIADHPVNRIDELLPWNVAL